MNIFRTRIVLIFVRVRYFVFVCVRYFIFVCVCYFIFLFVHFCVRVLALKLFICVFVILNINFGLIYKIFEIIILFSDFSYCIALSSHCLLTLLFY